ncbi:MAG: alpha/beta hydrolase, partial [Verrucomicrobiota bacterium]
FATANPGVSASAHWVTIEAQERALDFSRVELRWDPAARRVSGTTDNVGRLALQPPAPADGRPCRVELDGQPPLELVPEPKSGVLRLARAGGAWRPAGPVSRSHKGPHRAGPFKEAFGNRMQFVYATGGTPEENAWALAKARFDSESFWYRGNASIELVPDTAFRPDQDPERGVILYGHADSNAAWQALLGDSPVQVTREAVRIGPRTLAGPDLACLFLRPRPGSATASVGVVAGTGAVGRRLTERVPYFLAGVAFPDVTVFGPESLEIGAGGARAAGFFGQDWSVDAGEIAFRP